MVWKLIKALVRRIKAWGEIKTHVRLLLAKVENEERIVKEKEQIKERQDFLLYQLEQKRSDLLSICRHMNELENKRERVVVEDELL